MGASSSNATQDDDKNENFKKEGMEEVKQYIKEHGLTGLEEFLKAKLGEWKDVAINFAVTGFTGSGKSTFINAIRG